MKMPNGFKINKRITSDYIIKIHRNIYGLKQAGKVCNKCLTNILVKKVGFSRSTVDECVFYFCNVIYVLYTDDYILAGTYLK